MKRDLRAIIHPSEKSDGSAAGEIRPTQRLSFESFMLSKQRKNSLETNERIHGLNNAYSWPTWYIAALIGFCIVVRTSVAFHPYSGELFAH